MEIFNSFYEFFGLELLSDASTLADLINALVQVGLGVFIICFFIKALFSLMINIFRTDSIIS